VISFDTNILVYAADAAAGERHLQAAALIERAIRRGDCIQTLQSFCEFFSVTTRKSGISPGAAAAFVEGWAAVTTVEAADAADLGEAIRAVRQHRLAFWDALLWATVRRAGVRYLLSEDFQDRRDLEGVTFINPFAERNAALIAKTLPPVRSADPPTPGAEEPA
jgi:predicted nucleic acid-binding protein